MGAGARHRRGPDRRFAVARRRRHHHQHPRHPRRPRRGGRDRLHAGDEPGDAALGAGAGAARVGAVPGAAPRRQDRRHVRHRHHRRGAGAAVQGARHARHRRELGAARRARLRPDAPARRPRRGGARLGLFRVADAAHAGDIPCGGRDGVPGDEAGQLFRQSRPWRDRGRGGAHGRARGRQDRRRGARCVLGRAAAQGAPALVDAERDDHAASGRLLRRVSRPLPARRRGESAPFPCRRARAYDQHRETRERVPHERSEYIP